MSVTHPPTVRVTGRGAAPFAGAEVKFEVVSGNGSVTTVLDTTGADGLASAASWLLGTVAGTNSVRATATALPASPVEFTAVGAAGPPAMMTAIAGDGLVSTAGLEVATRPSVRVVDTHGNPVAGVTVSFVVTGGGGGVGSPVTPTDASGVATVASWGLGHVAGPNTLVAAVAGVPSLTFTATGIPGASAKLILKTPPAGALMGAVLLTQPVITIADMFDNLTADASHVVTVSKLSGASTLSGTTSVAAVGGVATFTDLVLNGHSGTQFGVRLQFTAVGLAGTQTLEFSVTGPPTQLGVRRGIGGLTSGVPFVTQPIIQLRDEFHIVVLSAAPTPVTATITSGTGVLSGTTTVTSVNGEAVFTNLRITGTGAHTITFTAPGLIPLIYDNLTVSSPPPASR
jgi:hypothetical protein